MQKPVKKKTNYVNNKDLYQALVQYRASPEPRVISNYIGLAIMQICNGLAKKGNFSGYSWRDEMVDDAIENCVYAVPHFNTEKSNNPFGYFTMVAYRAMIRRIQLEKKQTYIKHKNFQSFFDEGGGVGTAPNELSHQVIEQFEKKLVENKKKSRKGLMAAVDADDTSK